MGSKRGSSSAFSVDGAPMGLLDDILKALDRVDAWKALQEVPAKTSALEKRVSVLEENLARAPGQACPFCGARAFRFKRTMTWGKSETCQCEDCKQERVYRYDL